MRFDAFDAGTTARARRVVEALVERGLGVPDALREHVAGREVPMAVLRAEVSRATSLLHAKSASDLTSAIRVARSIDRRPREIGPYNGLAIATATLAAIEALSPRYLSALLDGLLDVAVLATLPPVEKVAKAPPPKRRRKAR
ncbi:MAG: hypothetical protein U0169_26720 [Polyangiaceae bacterium]